MWLTFGVDNNNLLVSIADVPSGKTELICPYCGGFLVAKKGKVKEHHFAHQAETCRSVETKRERPTLPLYDNFHFELSGKAFQLLKSLWQSCGQNYWSIPYSSQLKPLIQAAVLKKNPYLDPPGYEFTPLGQIPVGALSLKNFNSVQERLWQNKLSEFERKVKLAQVIRSLNPKETWIDLQLYRAHWKTVLCQRLYYLEVQADHQRLYKIGVTQRQLEERIREIKRDLHAHFKQVEIGALGSWMHRGNVELYFKHRYKAFNYPLGSLTEYYRFDTVEAARAALQDLQQMQPKVLNPIEAEILARQSSLMESDECFSL